MPRERLKADCEGSFESRHDCGFVCGRLEGFLRAYQNFADVWRGSSQTRALAAAFNPRSAFTRNAVGCGELRLRSAARPERRALPACGKRLSRRD